MPAKRRPAADKGGAPKARQSKLAKENNISAQEEAEIKEAFSLFSEPMDGEKEGIIPIDDVRRAMIALGIPLRSKAEQSEYISVLDPDGDGFATYGAFVAICALRFRQRDDEVDEEQHTRDVDEAFELFTGRPDAPAITIADLRRVAAALREDCDDDVLRDMIAEANGGAGVAHGVKKDEFDGVMERAGVWR